MRVWLPLLTLIGGLGLPGVASAAPTTYALNQGRLEVVVKYDRNAWVAGHDHVLVSTGFSGTVTWDPDDVSACDVRITLPVQTLTVDPPGARARHGFEGETSAGDKESIKKNALGDRQLQADDHPNITYGATSCKDGGGNTVVVTGDLTIRGITHPVQTTMTVQAEPGSFAAKGSFSATHSDFGFKPYSAALGAVKNDEKLTFYVDVKGTPK